MDKKGQVAIFIIIALVIAGVAIAVLNFPKLKEAVAPTDIAPEQYLEDCIYPDVQNTIKLLAEQGGEKEPVGYVNYSGARVKYLCYVSGYYKTCVVQQPLLMSRFGDEVSRTLTPRAELCVRNLEAEYRKRGFSVETGKISSSINLASGKIGILFNVPMTISNEQGTRKFEKFDINIDSQIYDLLAIATSIVDYEATFGDSETTLYLRYYPNLKIEKLKLEDGVKVYMITDVVSNERFVFATRSLVWPPGYGL